MNPKTFITDILEDSIMEVGLSRTLNHFGNREFAQISADRQELGDRERRAARHTLELALKDYGLGFVSMLGVGQEDTGNGMVASEELSYFVPNGTRKDGQPIPNFREKMLGLADELSQYAIIYGPGDGSAQLTLADGTVAERWPNWHASKSQYFTALRKGDRAFHYESIQRAYPGIKKVGWFAAAVWSAKGEITRLPEFSPKP
jgi:hypothetical protein